MSWRFLQCSHDFGYIFTRLQVAIGCSTLLLNLKRRWGLGISRAIWRRTTYAVGSFVKALEAQKKSCYGDTSNFWKRYRHAFCSLSRITGVRTQTYSIGRRITRKHGNHGSCWIQSGQFVESSLGPAVGFPLVHSSSSLLGKTPILLNAPPDSFCTSL